MALLRQTNTEKDKNNTATAAGMAAREEPSISRINPCVLSLDCVSYLRGPRAPFSCVDDLFVPCTNGVFIVLIASDIQTSVEDSPLPVCEFQTKIERIKSS